MASQRPPVSFRDADVERALAARARNGESRGLVASRDLARYYATLARALAALELTEGEASLISDALNGVLHTEHDAHLAWAGVDDALHLEDLGSKWGVDGPALVARLRAAGPWGQLAVVDAVERFWLDTDAPTGERLRAVGLVRDRGGRT